jgi:hypothetical protein
MKQIRKVLRLGKIDFYETHLSIINCMFPVEVKMTPMEIKVLAAFMALEGDVAQFRFGPTAKKIVMNSVNPEKPLSPAGLSNYITSLTNKKFIDKSTDMPKIIPLLTLEGDEQVYMIKLIKTIDNVPN